MSDLAASQHDRSEHNEVIGGNVSSAARPLIVSDPYEEILHGELTLRLPPGPRHELICERLHALIRASVTDFPATTLLARRSSVRVHHASAVRPDLALVTAATGRLWLAAEIVSADDHRNDTVIKKQIYEDIKVQRLWMIDPRYDNVEVYHCGEYGLALKHILAGKEVLSETLLPEFTLVIAELFAPATP